MPWFTNKWVPAAFLTLLAGCSSLPSREPPSQAPVAAVTPPASPSIPAPVPVGVRPSGRAPSADLDAELASIIAPDLSIPEPMAPPGDPLERVRAGLALGDVRHSRIDREAIFYARNPEYVERVFTRAAPYLHYIVGEVEQRGLPLELALLPIIESAFQPYAYSRARADGLWQFIPSTGGRFGLKQDWWYDGRRDVVAATQAALDYLTYLHDMFDGDWLAAIAAYNCGEGNVSRAIRRNRAAKMKTDFWNLKLPSETR